MEMSYGILNDKYLSEEKKKLYVSILELLYTSRFEETYEIIHTWSEKEQRAFVIEEAYESENISIICFVEFLISKENSYFHHSLAVDVLNARCWHEGAYSVALFHAKEMFRINPCVEALEMMLFYYEVHELTDSEAENIAKEILLKDPNNQVANSTLNDIITGARKSGRRRSEGMIEPLPYITENDFLSDEIKDVYVNIVHFIHTSRFNESFEIFRTLSEDQQKELVFVEASHTDEISIICFAEFLISKENSYFNHSLAAEILSQTLCFNGARGVAYYHAKEMLRLNPCVDARKLLLSFYAIPEKLLSCEYAVELAKDILCEDPDYEPAKEILTMQGQGQELKRHEHGNRNPFDEPALKF